MEEDPRQRLVDMIANVAYESDKEFAFLVAVEKSGGVLFSEVVKTGYDIRNARVIYITQPVEDYKTLTQAIGDLGLRIGLIDWLCTKLENDDSRFDTLRTHVQYWRKRGLDAESQVVELEHERAALLDQLADL